MRNDPVSWFGLKKHSQDRWRWSQRPCKALQETIICILILCCVIQIWDTRPEQVSCGLMHICTCTRLILFSYSQCKHNKYGAAEVFCLNFYFTLDTFDILSAECNDVNVSDSHSCLWNNVYLSMLLLWLHLLMKNKSLKGIKFHYKNQTRSFEMLFFPLTQWKLF